MLVAGDRRPHGECVAERHVDRTANTQQVVVTHGDVGVAVHIVHGRGDGDHVDRATGGVLAEQGALGATQHLDALQIQEVGLQGEGRGHVDAVQVVGHRGVGNGVLVRLVTHAPNGDDGLEALVLGDVYPRGDRTQVHKGGEISLVQVFCAEGGYRLGQVLQAFGPLLRCDNHFFEDGSGILCQGSHRQSACDRQAQGTQCERGFIHDVSL